MVQTPETPETSQVTNSWNLEFPNVVFVEPSLTGFKRHVSPEPHLQNDAVMSVYFHPERVHFSPALWSRKL